MFPEGLPLPPPLPTHLTRCWPIALAGIKWQLARRAPSQEVSPPAGAGRSSGTQHAGTAYAEDASQCGTRRERRGRCKRSRTMLALCDLGLVLGLLFLSTPAMGSCLDNYQELLGQLQKQADFMQHTSMLLDHYISIQGLDKDGLKEHCQERPGVFPSKDALQRLSRQEFLQILNNTLGHVLHRLRTLQKDIPKAQDLEKLNIAKLNIRGFKNNIHCMAQLLPGSLEKTEPTPTGPGASPSPTPISDAFQRRLEGCRFLHGYHRFMHSVGQVFREWGQSPSRSRRHSPRRGLRKGTHRTHLSSRNKRLMPRGWLPR
ncbi:oncostatin-M isoform X2 [Panthera uncia]|uniref:oncostatin-M isoform X2 n=1 Tax=Panthera uncia TaxID=29064 RepID=UPI0020FFA0CA|nr:oncostatin-M isoform X2 [Panthera uncia]